MSADGFKGLKIYNTLTRTKEDFVPIDPNNVRMYVCGPTVYDYAHIGNARPAIVFDVLNRLLRHLYGADKVTYVRNITDVDDKINARALRDYGNDIASGALSLNEAIRKVTEPTYDQYQRDVTALGCLPPDQQPRATEFVLPRADGRADMMTLIQSLIDRGHAYVSQGEVLFDTASMADYGQLSKRPLDEQMAGARIAVERHKKNPGDFVLWKESSGDEPGWQASFRLADGETRAIFGRPGWHIECSAMSAAYLGEVFDIHGGGLDLIFPHHENEIAQSRCAHGTEVMANYWMHNGFLQVEGKKMSKSDGNFVTIHELLHTESFGNRRWAGAALRLAMLMTHYREPIDFSVRKLEEATKELATWSSFIWQHGGYRLNASKGHWLSEIAETLPFSDEAAKLLSADLNTSGLLTNLRNRFSELKRDLHRENLIEFICDLHNLGLISPRSVGALSGTIELNDSVPITPDHVKSLRNIQIAHANFGMGFVEDELQRLKDSGVGFEFSKEGTISVEGYRSSGGAIEGFIATRLAFIAAKDWASADRIRDELLAQGIQLKDGKDPATGERITTWEVKR